MKFLSVFFASALLFTSCVKDPCRDVVCLNSGTCLDGTCLCQDWYEGANCGTEERAKYYGNYTGLFTATLNGQTVVSEVEVLSISDGAAINRLFLSGFNTEAKLNTSGLSNFDIIPFTMVSGGETMYYTGYGSFNGNQVNMYGQIVVSGTTLNWTYVATK